MHRARQRLIPLLLVALAVAAPAAAQEVWLSSNHLEVVDLERGVVIDRVELGEHIHDLVFSTDGATLYVASSHGLRALDPDLRTVTAERRGEAVVALDLRPSDGAVVALHRPPGDAVLAARRADLPLPPCEVVVHDPITLNPTARWAVDGDAWDLVVTPGGVHVIAPRLGALRSFDHQGRELSLRPLLPDHRPGDAHLAALGPLDVDAEGRIIVPWTDERGSYLAILSADSTEQRPLGHGQAIHGLAGRPGGGILLTSVGRLYASDERGLPGLWSPTATHYVDLAWLADGQRAVAAAPTAYAGAAGGSVSVIDPLGQVLIEVALPDMSPYHLAIRPR